MDVATQGKTEEVKENMKDLINDYFKDADTPKPKITTIMSVSLTNIPVDVPEGVYITRLCPLPQNKIIKILKDNGQSGKPKEEFE